MIDLATSNIFEMIFPKPTSDAGNWATNLFRSLGFARGGVFAGGRVQPFALGGVVTRPMLFPLANGTGLMGEAGPEAIMPLKRGPDGRLGVSAANANAPAAANSNVHVTVSVSVDQNGNLQAYVKSISRETTSAGIHAYDAGLPDRMMQIRRDPRLRR
jgi:phage-related minor tail protein